MPPSAGLRNFLIRRVARVAPMFQLAIALYLAPHGIAPGGWSIAAEMGFHAVLALDRTAGHRLRAYLVGTLERAPAHGAVQ